MREYKSLETFHIKGRGDVFIVAAPFDFEDRSELYGPCFIDGIPYTVKGIEAPAVERISKGTRIGLLV